MGKNNPVTLWERDLRIDGITELIDWYKEKYGRNYRRHCIQFLHNSFTFGWELERRLNGSRMGLRKRLELARAEGMII